MYPIPLPLFLKTVLTNPLPCPILDFVKNGELMNRLRGSFKLRPMNLIWIMPTKGPIMKLLSGNTLVFPYFVVLSTIRDQIRSAIHN